MPLVLEIEHLSGVCFAALGPDSERPDWPIQPDRVFSALVAAWAARGCDADEREALEWLEGQAPPLIEASEAASRNAPTVFVPPGDTRTRLGGKLDTLMGAAGRQPRRFPAVGALERERGLTTRLVWTEAVGDGRPLQLLDAMARDVAYVGHSSSLTRCRFLEGEAGAGLKPARRRIGAGRLVELERAFVAGRRPSPGETHRVRPAAPPLGTASFGQDWLVLELLDGGGCPGRPDVRAAPVLAKRLRDAVMGGYGRAGLDIPEAVSGHRPDRTPTRRPHLAVVPLAHVGRLHADAAVHGFALVPPAGTAVLDMPGLREALAEIAPYDPEKRMRRLSLNTGEASFELRFGGERIADALDPTRYFGPSATWATATPMVLDRHLKGAGSPGERQAEVEAAVVRACANVGLPPVEAVASGKHSAVEAAPSAAPSGRDPSWLRWRRPDRLTSRALVHAVIRFAEPVMGPVILGAGRFAGLGLCLPLDPQEGRRDRG